MKRRHLKFLTPEEDAGKGDEGEGGFVEPKARHTVKAKKQTNKLKGDIETSNSVFAHAARVQEEDESGSKSPGCRWKKKKSRPHTGTVDETLAWKEAAWTRDEVRDEPTISKDALMKTKSSCAPYMARAATGRMDEVDKTEVQEDLQTLVDIFKDIDRAITIHITVHMHTNTHARINININKIKIYILL